MLSACQWRATSQLRRKVFLLRWPRQTPSHPLWALRVLLPLNPTVVLLSTKGGFPTSPHIMACPTSGSHLLRLFSVRGTFLLKVFTSTHCLNSSVWHLRPFIEWCKPPFQYKSCSSDRGCQVLKTHKIFCLTLLSLCSWCSLGLEWLSFLSVTGKYSYHFKSNSVFIFPPKYCWTF